MKSILIVDDNPVIQNFIRHRYASRYLVSTYANGIEAYLAIREGKILPNLVLADIDMPEMDGIEFTEALKRSSNFRSIPVVILSGKTQSSDRIRAYESGADMYLQKPFNPVELDTIVKKIVD
jgi:DNA-binding response OmpR family regulator